MANTFGLMSSMRTKLALALTNISAQKLSNLVDSV